MRVLRQQDCFGLEVKVGPECCLKHTHTLSALEALATKPRDLSRSLEPRRDQTPTSCYLTST